MCRSVTLVKFCVGGKSQHPFRTSPNPLKKRPDRTVGTLVLCAIPARPHTANNNLQISRWVSFLGFSAPNVRKTAGGLHTASKFRLPIKTCWVNIVPCVCRIGQVKISMCKCVRKIPYSSSSAISNKSERRSSKMLPISLNSSSSSIGSK